MRKLSSTNYENQQRLAEDCPMTYTLNRIGGRWKLAIVWQLLQGGQRFGDLQRLLTGASAKMLSARLRELEEDGLVQREAAPEGMVMYRLTPAGLSLQPVLDALLQWGLQHRGQPAAL